MTAAFAVLGASRGIGQALVERASRDPAVTRVWASARSPPDRPSPSSSPHAVHWTEVDCTDEASVSRWVDEWDSADLWPRTVVVTAGLLLQSGVAAWELDEATLRRTLGTNVVGAGLVVARQVVRRAVEAGRQCDVLFVSSGLGLRCVGGGVADYSATKHGLEGFVGCMQLDLRERGVTGVRVFPLGPGMVHTGMLESYLGEDGIPDNVPDAETWADYAWSRIQPEALTDEQAADGHVRVSPM